MDKISISAVIPVYAGQEYLPALVEDLDCLHNEWNGNGQALQLLEAIFVDDAAIDQSGTILADLSQRYTWIKVVSLSKNYGQHPATVAGILYSSGDWVVTLDEDLQHRPENIVDLLRVVAKTSADIVYAKPVGSVHKSGYRDIASRYYKKLLALLTGNPIIEQFNSFRLVRGPVARAAASVCGYDTYFDVALNWFTNRVEVTHLQMKDLRHIKTGNSGYNLYKLLSHGRRLITSSQTKVLRFGAAIGVLSMMVALFFALTVLYDYLFYPGSIEVRGWTSLFIGIMFFGGISTFLLGIVLEYLTNMVLHSQGKPVFFVVDRSGDKLLRELFS